MMKTVFIRKFKLICLGLFILVLIGNLVMFHQYLWTSQPQQNSIGRREKMFTSGQPLIVFWAKQYHTINWKLGPLSSGDGGCEVSFDRKDIAQADAVVFFMKSCNPKDRPPATSRRRNQTYVWFSHESPWTTFNYYHHKLTEFNNYFNWTMTYRTDSDVVAAMWPTPAMDYLMFRLGRTDDMLDVNLGGNPRLSAWDYSKQVKALLERKHNLIAWIVSDCGFTQGAVKRLNTVKAIGNLDINLAKFGKCVGRPLPYNFTILFETLSSYKFYLAFENSFHCQDYLTEKTIYNSFVSGTVPVIHGPSKKDVDRILPKGSYIFVEDFENMQNLVNYLNYLDQNDSAYMEYFKWWMDAGAQTFPRYGFNYGPSYVPRNVSLPQYNKIELEDESLEWQRFGHYHLCRKLKRGDHINQTNIIPNLAEWWYGKQPPECRSGQ